MNRYLNTRSKKKIFNLIKGVREIELLIDRLPLENECFKFFSAGGFSSICFIRFIADRAKIRNMFVTTLRVGKKEIRQLDLLHDAGKIDHCRFVVGSFMKNDSVLGKSYQYFENFEKICKKNKWDYELAQNHSKILLFDTDAGKYVIETSSNLNENPKCEQFSFEKSAELYDMYFDELMNNFMRGSNT